jgi:hypothetical protein
MKDADGNPITSEAIKQRIADGVFLLGDYRSAYDAYLTAHRDRIYLMARITELEAALKRYGQHDFWHCDSVKVQTDPLGRIVEPRLPCTCGFAPVRSTLENRADDGT